MSGGKRKRKRKNLFELIKQVFLNPFTIGYILLLTIIVIATKIVFDFETQTESGITTVFDSVWFTLITIMAGYFDYYILSVPGRMAALVLLALGMVLLSVITGKIASVFMDIQMKKEKGLIKMDKFKGHFLICGWKNDFEAILDGIILANPDIPCDHIVLMNTASQEALEPILSERRFHGIKYISGDFTEPAALNRANIKQAARVLVLSDYSHPYSLLEIDSRTVLAVLTIGGLNPHLYIAAELIDSKFESHLTHAHCDEIILSREYERKLLVSASSGTGISHVMRDLIGDTLDEGLCIEDIPARFINKTFAELKTFYNTEAKNGKVPPIPIGVLENTGNFFLRRKEALTEAQKNPNVQNVISNLRKVKELKSNHPILAPSGDYVLRATSKLILVYATRDNSETGVPV